MSLVLNLDKSRCPQCGFKNSIRWDQHRCCECNAKVFKPTDNFVQMKYDWVLAYWVWFDPKASGLYRGWVNSSHLDNPDPYSTNIKVNKPDKNYGMRKAGASASRTVEQLSAMGE